MSQWKIQNYKTVVSIFIIIAIISSLVIFVYYNEQKYIINDIVYLREVKSKLDKALSFLSKNQLPSGEFSTLESYFPAMMYPSYISSPFVTNFVIHSLNFVDQDPMVISIKEKAIDFLLSQKESIDVWKFYGTNSTEYLQSIGAADLFDFPDMDDTCLALKSLSENNAEYDPKTLDYLLNFTNEEGVFYTWIKEEGYNDIDEVVNANILYFFSSQGIQLPDVCNYLNEVAENNEFENGSIYYSSPYAFTYSFTRAFSEGNARCLNHSIPYIQQFLIGKQAKNGIWNNELETSLAVISLMNCDYWGGEVDIAIKFLLDSQSPDGSWPLASFFIGGTYNAKVRFGSEELTTSFSLEALAKYYNHYS